MVCESWFVNRGSWIGVCELWFVVRGSWFVDRRLRHKTQDTRQVIGEFRVTDFVGFF